MKPFKILHLRSGTHLFGPERIIISLARCASPSYQHTIAGIERGSESLLVREAASLGIQAAWFRSYRRLDTKCVRDIARYISSHEIDLVHAHDFKANFYALAARRNLPVKTVTTLHLWNRSSLLTGVYEILDRLQIRLFDKVIAVSPAVAAQARRWKIPERKLQVILNGVDISRFASSSSAPVRKVFTIGSVGRLVSQKGYDLLLEACARIFADYADTRLVLVGDGPLREDLERRAQDLGISERVTFAGQTQEVEKALADMDLFVSSSLDEGLPVAVLEAMAARLPVVATMVGAADEVIENEKSGLLIKPDDVEALTYSIRRLREDKALRKALAEAGYRRVEEDFSAEKMTRKTEAVYAELLNACRK